MHRHTVTEKQLAANRANGQKGGRPSGRKSPEMIAARRAVRETLVDMCRKNEKAYLKELERIALYGVAENARLQAISMLLDRGHGRAVSYNDHNAGA
jgi:hypothetical protein